MKTLKEILPYYLGTGLKCQNLFSESSELLGLTNKTWFFKHHNKLLEGYLYQCKPHLRTFDSITKPITIEGYNGGINFLGIGRMSQYGNYNSIAIAISTYNRPEAFAQTLKQIKKYTPSNIPIYIVDGCSPKPYTTPHHQFTHRATISQVKNKCLELCYPAVHTFLFDDDTYPTSYDWYKPYINSDQSHLAYCFGLEYGRNNHHKFHTVGKGCMLYFKKICIDTIGGFDTLYHNKFEHVDISYRIFNAGLTIAPFIDVINSDKLLYCHDQDNSIQRTLTQQERDFNRHIEARRHNKLNLIEKSSRYINFK